MTKRQRNWVMVSLLLASLMSGLDATIINTALPAIFQICTESNIWAESLLFSFWEWWFSRRFWENSVIESETRKPLDYRF